MMASLLLFLALPHDNWGARIPFIFILRISRIKYHDDSIHCTANKINITLVFISNRMVRNEHFFLRGKVVEGR